MNYQISMPLYNRSYFLPICLHLKASRWVTILDGVAGGLFIFSRNSLNKIPYIISFFRFMIYAHYLTNIITIY